MGPAPRVAHTWFCKWCVQLDTPRSGIFWLRKRVPADLQSFVGKREEKISLRTRDAVEAKIASGFK